MNPGEVWEWEGDGGCVFLILNASQDVTRVMYLSYPSRSKWEGVSVALMTSGLLVEEHVRLA